VLVDHPLGGRTWDQPFGPHTVDQLLVLVGVPAVVVLAGLLPTRATSRDPLAVAHRADRTPPGWWRLVPLVVGVALCTVVVAQGHQTSSEATNRQVALFFGGVGLLAVGLVLVLPVLVRLVTRALAGRPLGPAGRIAVRRLEAQPAGVARIIGALLIGLFLVTGARYVLVAFESTPQYLAAAYNAEREARAATEVPRAKVPGLLDRLAAAPDVREAVDLPMLHFGRFGLEAVVATCADLARIGAEIGDCRDGEPMWVGSDNADFARENFDLPASATEITWLAGTRGDREPGATTPIDLPVAHLGTAWAAAPVWVDAIIPPDLAGDLPDVTRHQVVITSPPGTNAADVLLREGAPSAYGGDDSEYQFVATMRSVIWTIAGVVVGIGLLALTIATVDRAVQRRKEVVALRLVGLGAGVVRRAQLLESAVPLVLGIVLSVGLGALAGSTFLTLDETLGMPWTQTWRLAAVAVLGGLAVAAVCTAAAVPRLRPEEIRAE
jgi:putative ABC transport system permease protein